MSRTSGLEALGVKVEKTHIVTDGFGKTNVPGLYAIGDVCGPPWLAHKAMHEGVIVVEGMQGKTPSHKFDPWNVPGCTYSHPQVASVGLTEEAAKKTGRKLKIGKFPFIGNGKAIALGEPEGIVKTIFDEADRRTPRRPHGGRGRHRTDPGLLHRASGRTDRSRADGNRLPAPDAQRDDARERAGRLRPAAPHLEDCRQFLTSVSVSTEALASLD